ncbi:hypothetical protein STXM2123_2155 [Streptomyces sp. F-3]|nr:hypothetical protein STXM2123_2155 [Streptomyces sp. F-3]
MLERGQVDLSGHLTVLRHRSSSGGCPAFRRRDESFAASRRVRRAPAVPPSLAPRCAVRSGEPPHWNREAGSTDPRAAPRAFFRRLRGDLHVALAPGLPPSPGRSGLRTALLVPINAFRSAQCTAPEGRRPTGFPGRALTRMAWWRRSDRRKRG